MTNKITPRKIAELREIFNRTGNAAAGQWRFYPQKPNLCLAVTVENEPPRIAAKFFGINKHRNLDFVVVAHEVFPALLDTIEAQAVAVQRLFQLRDKARANKHKAINNRPDFGARVEHFESVLKGIDQACEIFKGADDDTGRN